MIIIFIFTFCYSCKIIIYQTFIVEFPYEFIFCLESGGWEWKRPVSVREPLLRAAILEKPFESPATTWLRIPNPPRLARTIKDI